MRERRRSNALIITIGCAVIIMAFIVLAIAAAGGGSIRAGARRIAQRFDRASGNEIAAALEALAEKNPEAIDYAVNYRGPKAYDLALDLSDELPDEGLPYFTQWDARWGYCRYGSGLIGYTGCGPTCLSLVAMGLTGDGTLTPACVAHFAEREGYSVAGSGTSWTLFSEGAGEFGLLSKELPLDEGVMKRELKNGRPIICVMGPGHFTESGHYIIITGFTDDGFTVLDPNRPSNNEKSFPYDDISGEIRNLWSYELWTG